MRDLKYDEVARMARVGEQSSSGPGPRRQLLKRGAQWSTVAGALILGAACGAGDGEPATGALPNFAQSGSNGGSGTGQTEGEPNGDPASENMDAEGGLVPVTVDEFEGVSGYDRAPGMPIGGDEPAEGSESNAGAEGAADSDALPEGNDNQDLEIPTFEAEEDTGPPCSQCIELSVHLDSPDQQASFAFDAGGVNVTRVTWNLILLKNEDQLFVRTSVNGGQGPYRQTLANTFPIVGAPFEYVHEQGQDPNITVWQGNANQVGLIIGSSGGWARNERMRVFVDSVILEGADGASRTFATGPQGVVATSTAQDPQVTYYP